MVSRRAGSKILNVLFMDYQAEKHIFWVEIVFVLERIFDRNDLVSVTWHNVRLGLVRYVRCRRIGIVLGPHRGHEAADGFWLRP